MIQIPYWSFSLQGTGGTKPSEYKAGSFDWSLVPDSLLASRGFCPFSYQLHRTQLFNLSLFKLSTGITYGCFPVRFKLTTPGHRKYSTIKIQRFVLGGRL